MKDVAGLFVQRAQRTLLVFKKGFWFFPGGKREAGENLLETLARELLEELGMTWSSNPRLLHSGVFPAMGDEVFCFNTYTCDASALVGVPRLRAEDSVKEWRWVDTPQELNLTPHARFIIETFG